MSKPIEIIITDTHLSKKTIEENISIFSQAISLASEFGIETIHHLGDIFTNRESQSLSTLLAFYKVLELFKNAGIKLVAIPGNHDKVSLNSNSSYLDIFRQEFFEVVDKPEIRNKGGKEYCFLPYYKEVDKYPQELSELVKKVKTKDAYLFTHIAVDGVRNNDGSVVENDLGSSNFSVFKKAFVGHYHNSSQVGENIFYIGSSFPHNFGEDDEKGFTVLCEDGSHYLHIPNFKKYIKQTISVDELQSNPDIVKQFGSLAEENHVRFVLTGDDTKLKSFNKKILDENRISVQLKSDKTEENISQAENEEYVSFDKPKIIDNYKKFCSEKGYGCELGISYLESI